MDMNMWNSTITHPDLRATILGLQKLKQVPARPRDNSLGPAPAAGRSRFLSRERECEIAGNLAFISAISDDNLKVMAVCIEEDSTGQGITIRLASNSGDLTQVTCGLRGLAKALEEAACRRQSRAEDVTILFRHTVALDFPRILSRLRSRHANRSRRTAGRPALAVQLRDALNHRSTKALSTVDQSRLKFLRSSAQAFLVPFRRLEALTDSKAQRGEACALVREMILQAHEITAAGSLSAALQNSLLDPSLKTHLPEAVGKVGRYYSVAFELVCASRDKKCRVFRNTRVEPFQITKPPIILEAGLMVPAEIQLLFFYEVHPDRLPPRTICSNKSACYLCSLFFELHGKYHVPSTHGRLYDRWCLPYWMTLSMERRGELSTVLVNFKTVLDRSIERESRSSKGKCYLPNESVLQPYAYWASSSALSGRQTTTNSTESTIRPARSLINHVSPMPGVLCDTIPSRRSSALSVSAPVVYEADIGSDRGLNDTGNGCPTGSPVTLAAMSPINITYKDLPFILPIIPTTPSLSLQLKGLFVILDFIHVTSGNLSILQKQSVSNIQDYQLVETSDIPSAMEMLLSVHLARVR